MLLAIDSVNTQDYYDGPLCGWVRFAGSYYFFLIEDEDDNYVRTYNVYECLDRAEKLKELLEIRDWRHLVSKSDMWVASDPDRRNDRHGDYAVYAEKHPYQFIPWDERITEDKFTLIGQSKDLNYVEINENFVYKASSHERLADRRMG